MSKYNLIDTFFSDVKEYIHFLVSKKQIAVANDICMASLEKLDGKYLYMLTHIPSGLYIGDYIKPFSASRENIDTFNTGCKILADRLALYINTEDLNVVPAKPPAFGILTHE